MMTAKQKTRLLRGLRYMAVRQELRQVEEKLPAYADQPNCLLRHKWVKLRAKLDVLIKEMNDAPCKQHIVQFSGGVGSWFAAKRVIERFGKENVTLLFADTKMEDEDLYRFIREASAKFDVPLTILCDGRTPWDVFHDKSYLGNTRADPCSLVLKRELLWGWIERNASKNCVIYVGIDWSEDHRLQRLQEYRTAFKIESPLLWPPMPDKIKMLKALEKDGIKIPRLYHLGFAHNNCGGFCVKSGQSQFRLLLETMPERYAFHEQKEQELRQYLEKDISILRDRRGGKTRPMTLKEFRERIERGEQHENEWGGCGCAIE